MVLPAGMERLIGAYIVCKYSFSSAVPSSVVTNDKLMSSFNDTY